MAARVRGDHAFGDQELKHPADGGAAPAGERPDVSLVDGSVRTDPGQQDPQRPGPGVAAGGVPAVLPGVLTELVQQRLATGSEGGQLAQFANGEAGPVAAHVEQRGLRRIDQVR